MFIRCNRLAALALLAFTTSSACVADLGSGEDNGTTNASGPGALAEVMVEMVGPDEMLKEGDDGRRIYAALTQPVGFDVTVSLSVEGTATEGLDYDVTSHEIVIAAGDTEGLVMFDVVDDSEQEPDETVVFIAAGATDGVAVGPQDEHTFTIRDNDLQAGTVVAKLETETPPANMCPSFVLNGTVPVPAQTFPRADGQYALAITDYDGTTALPSNISVVSYYPADATDGADVIELAAEVQCDPSKSPGDLVTYNVVVTEPYAPPTTAADDAAGILAATPGSQAPVTTLLQSPESIRLRARDVLGNVYEADILTGEHVRPLDFGSARSQVRTTGVMRLVTDANNPASGCSTSTYPHLFGYQAYWEVRAGEPLVRLALRLHNGFVDHDDTTADDDALLDVLFDQLELLIPSSAGFVVEGEPHDPQFDATSSGISGEHTVFPLVKAMAGGELHLFPHRSSFVRPALAIVQAGAEAKARELLRRHGLAFAQPGTNSFGHELYGGTNIETGRFGSLRARMPKLDHMGKSALRSHWTGEYQKSRNHVQNGDTDGWFYLKPTMGAFHPVQPSYGGVTGGGWIDFDGPGYDVLFASSRAGYLYYELFHRGMVARHTAVHLDADGDATSVEDWLVNGSLPFPFFGTVPSNVSADPFGDKAYDKCVNGCGGNTSCIQSCRATHPEGCLRDYANGSGQAPWYANDLKKYSAVDYQHYVRITRQAKFLAWAGNDPLAKDSLIELAEIGQLSYHQYQGNSSGLRGLYNSGTSSPGQGSAIGRGQGWIVDSMVSAYSVASPEWRQIKRPWFEMFADAVASTQNASCQYSNNPNKPNAVGGPLSAKRSNDHLLIKLLNPPAPWSSSFADGELMASQTWEEMVVVDVGVMGTLRAVFEGFDANRTQLLTTVIERHANYMGSDYALHAQGTTADQLAHSLCLPQATPNGPPVCTAPFVPFCHLDNPELAPYQDVNSGQYLWAGSTQSGNFYSPDMWGVAYFVTGDTFYLDRAALAHNAADWNALLTKLENQTASNFGEIQNRLVLIAALRSALDLE